MGERLRDHRAKCFAVPIVLVFNLAWSNSVSAHAFGGRYDLPLPLWMFLTGAGTAVALSFLVAVWFVREDSGGQHDRRDKGVARWLALPLIPSAIEVVLQALSIAIFTLILAAGLSGSSRMMDNFSTVFVWIVWWVGMAFLQALFGDVWSMVNPWAAFYDWATRLYHRMRLPLSAVRPRRYPDHLSYWPAVIFFLIFTWLENVSRGATQPAILAWWIIAYSIITWLGMILYGRDLWLRHGEVFTVIFGLFARFGPFYVTRSGSNWRLKVRPYGIGLLTSQGVSTSLIFVVLLLLSSVSFDGFEETQTWADIEDGVLAIEWLRPILDNLRRMGISAVAFSKTVALLVAAAVFLVAFVMVSAITDYIGFGRLLAGVSVHNFVLTLVPIALAYHVAHYLSYFLIAGQLIIPRISDPLGFGWDIFGTADYRIDITIVNAKFVWYAAVISIVIGHVYAIYLAHVMALRVFASRRTAVQSQIPILALMVGYTMTSLWILAQPIVTV